ncbi:bifunctional lysylphosphatidylglycerol flippase/synthetase MprF [Arthrobacter cupressi]
MSSNITRRPAPHSHTVSPGAGQVPPRHGSRLRNTKERLDSFFRRIPFSFLMAAVFLAAALFGRTLFGGPQSGAAAGRLWGQGVDPTFEGGRWWTLLTALLVPQDATATALAALGAVLLLGLAERTLGTRKAALAFFATGLAGGFLGILLQWLGTLTWEWWSTSASTSATIDPLTGVLGALSTATGSMGLLWRRRIRVILLTFVLIFVLYSGDPEDVYRLLAVLAGFPLGALLAARTRPLDVVRSSHRETRTLLAAVVLVTAAGPLVAFLGSTDLTPFAFGSYLFMNDPVDPGTLAAACRGDLPLSHACLHQLARIGTQGPGTVVLAFVPVALLGLAAWGLYRGRRFGWWLAVGVNAAILLVSPGSFGVVRVIAQAGTPVHRPFNGQELVIWMATAALVPAASLIMLMLKRRHFGIKAPRPAFRRFLSVILGSFLVLAGACTVAALAALKSIAPRITPARVFLEAPRRFVPPHFLGGPPRLVLPRHTAVSWAYQWAGPAFWAVFALAALWLLSRSPRLALAHDAGRFRALLRRHGGGSLGHMTTWEGNTPWFAPDGEGALAYRVVNGQAIVLGEPVCAPGAVERTIREFLVYCDEHNWAPVFYSFHAALLPVFEGLGWRHMPVGEETVIRTEGLTMKGKQWQSVRTALNKAGREGTTALWTSWDELPFAATTEIAAISESWVAENKLPEMGFTLGGLEELKDPEVRLMLAVAEDGHIEALTSWMPVYENMQVVAWTLDFMRRAPGAHNGVMEFLIASAALHLQAEQAQFVSLSGAPLAANTAPGAAGGASRGAGIDAFLGWLSKTLEPAYGFGSLFRFKAKFHPEYSTLFMAFPDIAALPGIGVALARAYLPEVGPRESMGLARALGRRD